MKKQPQWTIQEAIILLDGFLKLNNKKLSRVETIKYVSSSLRNLATINEQIIDDVYRNENGIAFQLASMESAFYGYTITKPATKLFSQVVELYNNNNQEYERMLKGTLEMLNNSTINHEEAFMKWMSTQISPSQLSELYYTFREIERFCLCEKIIDTPLFDDIDIVRGKTIREAVEFNPKFRSSHKGKLAKYVAAAIYYARYCKKNEENKIKNNSISFDKNVEDKSADEKLEQQYPIIYKKIKNIVLSAEDTLSPIDIKCKIGSIARLADIEYILCNASWGYHVNKEPCDVVNSLQESTANELASQIQTVDFFSTKDLSFTEPFCFSYFKDKYENLRSWKDLYIKLIKCLYDDYPHILKSGMCFSKSTSSKPDLISTNQQNIMLSPKKIEGSDLFVETNLSSTNIMNKIRYLLDVCNVDCENVIIQYKKRTDNLNQLTFTDCESYTTPAIPIADEKYKNVLKEKFVKGYRIGSVLDLKKFKRFYLEINGAELLDDDDKIVSLIRKCGIVHDDKLFVPETMLSDEMKNKLFSYIKEEFAQGKKVIYHEALFRMFSEQFLDYYIYDTEMMKSYLAYYNNGKYHITSNYIAKERGIESKPYDEVKDYLIDAGIPVSSDVICEDLSHIPSKKVMQILGMNAEFINNGKSHYFHVSAINLSQEELENISILITDLIEEKEFISGNELISAINAKYPYITDNNNIFSFLGMRDAIKYNLQDSFSFAGNVISKKGNSVSMSDVFANYAKSKSSFDIAELITLAEEMNSGIYFEDVYKNAFRISQTQFVAKDQAQFKIDETDLAIDRFCNGSYMPINDVTEFGSFPDSGFQWNHYLLASFVYAYSKKYKLLTAGFNRNTCVGAIVNRNSNIETFDDFIAIALAEGKCILKKDNALDYLVEQGYLARRSYSNIENVLIQANAQRNMKGTD